jgi:hypothetical protein
MKRYLINLLAGLSGMSLARRLGAVILAGALACTLTVSPALARGPGRAPVSMNRTFRPGASIGRRPQPSRDFRDRSRRVQERRHRHTRPGRRHHGHHHHHRHHHHYHHLGRSFGQSESPSEPPSDSPYASGGGDSGGYPDYAATSPGRDSYDGDEEEDGEADDERGEPQWPLALRILPPGPETAALREHVSSLVAMAECQAAGGDTDPVLLKALSADVRRLQQLLAERGDLLPVSGTAVDDARHFLNHLSESTAGPR